MSENLNPYQKIKTAQTLIETRVQESLKSPFQPRIGIILGSGLNDVVQAVKNPVSIPYGDIPFFHKPSVEGHAGIMTLGTFNNVPVAILQGRFHRYEGYEMEEVVFPTRVVCSLGIHTLILTNAAGGINTRFHARDLMLIEDHINLTGDNPLKGKNIKELGPRFPDLTEAYSPTCIKIFEQVSKDIDCPVQKGVYAGVLGPTYETPAEIRMLRTLGADSVGMSTVPETIAATHLGVPVAGISCITNLAAGLSPCKLTHEEVMEISLDCAQKLKSLLHEALPKIDEINKLNKKEK